VSKGSIDVCRDLLEVSHGAIRAHGKDSDPPGCDDDGEDRGDEYSEIELGVLRHRHRVRSGHAILETQTDIGPVAKLGVVRRGVLVGVEPGTARHRHGGREGSRYGVSDGSSGNSDRFGDSDSRQDQRCFER
jgi:hypothetical protein